MKRILRSLLLIAAVLTALLPARMAHGEETAWKAEQTDATSTSVTLSWEAVEGASSYMLLYKEEEQEQTEHISLTETSVELPLPIDTIIYYKVSARNEEDQELQSSPVQSAATCPGLIRNCIGLSWNGSGNTATFGMTSIPYPHTLSGIEWELWDRRETRMLRSGRLEGGSLMFRAKAKSDQVYRLKVRGFVNNSGRYFYGSWFSQYVVPEPKAVEQLKVIKKAAPKLMLRWRAVAGADRYIIHASKKRDSGFKRIAVVSGRRTSCVISRIRRKALIPGRTYYFRISAAKGRIKSTRKAVMTGTIPSPGIS